MNDIGVVEYSKDAEKNCILAKWYYSIDGRKTEGTGIATGELKAGYEGEYEITYYYHNNAKSSQFHLVIAKSEEQYELKWIANNQLEFVGIGFEYDGKLFAGWKKYQKDV